MIQRTKKIYPNISPKVPLPKQRHHSIVLTSDESIAPPITSDRPPPFPPLQHLPALFGLRAVFRRRLGELLGESDVNRYDDELYSETLFDWLRDRIAAGLPEGGFSVRDFARVVARYFSDGNGLYARLYWSCSS